MAIRVTRLGSPRAPGEDLRLGTVRRPPRGVRKQDYARRAYYDPWVNAGVPAFPTAGVCRWWSGPELAPSAGLLRQTKAEPFTDRRWARFVRAYRREMRQADRQHMLGLLARLSHQTNFSVGCYCAREERCHRSVLRELLAEHGAKVAPRRRTSR